MYNPSSYRPFSAVAAGAAAFVMLFAAIGPVPATAVSSASPAHSAVASADTVKCFGKSATDCQPIRA